MDNLQTYAKNGTLNRDELKRLLNRQEVDDEDDYGETPLTLAIRGGHVGAVKLLLQHEADANHKAPDGKTPLYMATQTPANSARIVELLLKHGAKVDQPIAELENDTPLMEAIRRGSDPDAIRLLVDHGASLAYPNKKGETGQSLADKSPNIAVQKALRPKNEQPPWKPELENLLVSAGLFGLAYFGSFKDIGSNAIRRLAALNGGPANKDNSTQYPQTEEEFKDHIEDFIADKGLEDFYPKDCDFVKNVAKKAAELLQKTPGGAVQSKIVTMEARQALYQPILYCDDSGSMKETDNMPDGTGDRMNRQADLVERMADLMTRASFEPPDDRVHLRFINSTANNGDNLKYDELRSRMVFTPNGSTKLGTNLKAKVLDEFLYNPLNKGEKLKRPLLILVITDGCPNEEPEQEFRNTIVDSLNFVKAQGYGPEAVRYDLSQVGNATEATNFLKSWEGDSLVPQRVNVNGEHLDSKFDWLRKNDDDLDQWLLERLNREDPVNF